MQLFGMQVAASRGLYRGARRAACKTSGLSARRNTAKQRVGGPTPVGSLLLIATKMTYGRVIDHVKSMALLKRLVSREGTNRCRSLGPLGAAALMCITLP